MKDEYVLYLDESEFSYSKTFTIAGIAIKKDNIRVLEQGLEAIKRLIWEEEYITNNMPILHCTDFQRVFDNRNTDDVSKVKPEYQDFIRLDAEEIEKKYNQVYGRMSQLLKKVNATVFSCVVKLQQLHDLFYIDENHDGIHLIDDKYNIALQKVIENYTHYLSVNDGYGDVIYESRNSIGENSSKSPDIRLINVYHKIQANNKGIVYTDSKSVQERNRTIVAYSKSENIAGLQIADFVAYNTIKFEKCNVEKQITDFMKTIHRLSYNGGHQISEKDQRSFWGIKVLPSYLRMEELIASNRSLKNAVSNLKKERKKLKREIEVNKNRIMQLEETIASLRSENERMKTETTKTNAEND